MSSVEKLLIRGIRSFDPQSSNVIEFYTPLTLIVGHNGSGKTTIIECLKYATTGELPPNSKGGAFIHDPNLLEEALVKAQIKLKFRNVNGKPLVATRSLQLMQRKTKREMKTLDAVLCARHPETGEQISISSRCAELDVEIPNQLGVSKAILDNVIFCHQEESNWPLSEPATLKKKFDDIFAATKYTKALAALKLVRKNQATELRVQEADLRTLQVQLDKANKLRSSIQSIDNKLNQSSTRIQQLTQLIQGREQQIQEFEEQFQQLAQWETERQQSVHERHVLQQQSKDLASTMKQRTESDQVLDHLLDEQNKLLQQKLQSQQQWQQQKSTLEQQLQSLQQQLQQQFTERGQFLAEKALFEQEHEKLSQFVKNNASEVDLDQSVQPDQFLLHLEQLSQSHSLLMKQSQQQQKSKEQTLQQQLQQVQLQQSSLMEQRRMKRKQLESLREQSSQILVQLNKSKTSIHADPSDLEMQLSVMQSEQAPLEQQCQSIAEKIGTLEKEQSVVEEKNALLTQQLTQLGKERTWKMKQEIKETEIKRKQQQLDQLFSENKFLMDRLLGTGSSNNSNNTSSLLLQIESKMKAFQSQLDQSQQEQDSLSWTVKHETLSKSELQEKMNSHQMERAELQKDLDSAMQRYNQPDLSALMRYCNKQLTLHQRDMNAVYQSWMEQIQQDHACPLCEASLEKTKNQHQPISTTELINKLKKLIISNETKDLSFSWTHLQSQYNRMNELDTLIHQLRQQFNALTVSLQSSSSALEEKQSLVSKYRMQQQEWILCQKQVEECDRLSRDIQRLQLENNALMQPTSNQSEEELNQSLEINQKHLNQVRSQLQQNLSQQRLLQQKLAQHYETIRHLKESLFQIQVQTQEQTRLKQDNVKLQESIEKEEKVLVQLEQDQLGPLAAQVAYCQQCLSQFQNEMVKENENLSQQWQKVQSLLMTCRNYMTNAKQRHFDPSRLDQCLFRVSQLQEQQSKCEASLSSVEKQIHSLASIQQIEQEKRQIQENIKYRQWQTRLEKLTQSIDELTRKINSFSLDKNSLQQSRKELQLSMDEKSALLGEKRQLETLKVEQQSELKACSVDEAFQTHFVRCEALKLALRDLDQYAKALDAAIIKYHSVKMNEMNKTMRELWTLTYQGTDIDSIEIRSDLMSDSEAAATTPSSSNRVYNYRVVMKKNHCDLDMRGRSSAGQRVLVSLIIRLALAESFGTCCGILALDEPTVNLDASHCTSLAQALARIIQQRKRQCHFQLIVITHDEQFVRELGMQARVDYYYRVSKNDQYDTILVFVNISRQCSVIERQSMINA